jgi:hypothetical protein
MNDIGWFARLLNAGVDFRTQRRARKVGIRRPQSQDSSDAQPKTTKTRAMTDLLVVESESLGKSSQANDVPFVVTRGQPVNRRNLVDAVMPLSLKLAANISTERRHWVSIGLKRCL